MQIKGRKLSIILPVLLGVFLVSTCIQAPALAAGNTLKSDKPFLISEGMMIVNHYSGGKPTGYEVNDNLTNTGASGRVELKVEVKYSNGAKVLGKTQAFTAKAGKKYHVSIKTGSAPGETRGTSYVTISSPSIESIDQYELKKVLITSIGDIKVEEIKNNDKLAQREVYAGNQMLTLDDKGKNNYSAYVDSNIDKIDVLAAAEDPDALVSINGQSLKKSLKRTIALKAGENIINISVTAPDGQTSSASIIKITRSAAAPSGKKWVKSYGTVSKLAADKSGVIYAGVRDKSGPYLLALNKDGTEKWKYSAPNDVGAPVAGTDGTIYAPCKTKLIAVSPAGKLKWQYEAGSEIPRITFLGKDGTIYIEVISADYTDKQLAAISPQGKKLWEYKTGSIYSSFLVGADSSIYYTTWDMKKGDNGKMLCALKPDRSKKWDYPIGALPNDLALDKNNTLYLSFSNKTLLAVDPASGTKKWETSFDSIPDRLAVGADNTIYAGGSGVLYATEPGGLKKWETGLGKALYGLSVSTDGIIYVSSENHEVYAVDSNGTKKQEFMMTGVSYYPPVVMADGTVCVSTEDGKIIVFRK